jgi:uncharacterized protein
MFRLTPEIEARFPLLEPVSRADIKTVEAQIGRPPRGKGLVAARCLWEKPAVLLTMPAPVDGDRILPLLWLTCPHAANGAGYLESEGFIEMVRARLEADPEARATQLMEDEELSRDYYQFACRVSDDDFAGMIAGKGIAGGRIGSVKCLHAHLAYRLAGRSGIVGGWVMEELERRRGVWCQTAPEACID